METRATRAILAALCLLVTVHGVNPNTETRGLIQEDHIIGRDLTKERVRRQAEKTDKSVRGFTEEEKRILVERHNALRRNPKASDIEYMYWDNDLEALAQDWAANCNFNHRPGEQRKDVGSFGYVGENLYASSGGYDAANVVQLWYDEVVFYNYNTMVCTPNQVCGHYTQVVWATSHAVGCGVAYCPVLRGVGFGSGFHVACNYGPGGNYQGERPYQTGQSCSQCPDDALFCINGLCARYPVIDPSGAVGGAVSRDQSTLSFIGCLLASFISLTMKNQILPDVLL